MMRMNLLSLLAQKIPNWHFFFHFSVTTFLQLSAFHEVHWTTFLQWAHFINYVVKWCVLLMTYFCVNCVNKVVHEACTGAALKICGTWNAFGHLQWPYASLRNCLEIVIRSSKVSSCVGAARKVSPNWSQERMTCHSFNCSSIVLGHG